MTVSIYYGAEIMTRYYVGDSYMLEVQPNTSNEYTYLGGDAYTAPVVVHNARGAVSYYYLLRDYLGNITHQVNTSNAVVAEYSFDAWGRRRNATNWTYTLDANDKALFADRGFTGHEYLPWYSLYNMNGRLYDPVVGRFLNVDPFVQNPGNTQSYNRYSYCLNNPLKYADPTGNKWRWKWLNPLYWFETGMQAINDNTEGLRKDMAKAGIPDFNVGMNVNLDGNVNYNASYKGQQVINTQNIDRSDISVQKFNRELKQVIRYNMQAWMEASYGVSHWVSSTYNSAVVRMILPDFVAIGVGFSGIAGVGGASSIEFRWVTHGPEASWKPMISATQSVGGGFSVDATLNIETANYIGSVNNITRSMMQTSTPSGDFPTVWGSGGVAAGGKIGITGYITPNVGGSFIIGRELNLGFGLPAGPFPVNFAGGISNTWILYDFFKY